MSRSKNQNRPLSEYPLVLIEWIEASRIFDGWIDLRDVPSPQPHRCVSVGFLVNEDKRGKILIPTVADVEHPENRHAYGGMLIPSAAIISIKRL
jgi:hypothetical protein